jgi:hypothetical protein
VKTLLACWLTAVAVLVWLALFSPPTFAQQWAPAIEHPLHAGSMVRTSFCYPVKCLNG